MRSYDLTPLYRNAIGFDRVFDLLDNLGKVETGGYPPYNIERIGLKNGAGEVLRITLAVAGFSRDQLEVTLEDNQLTIHGRQEDDKSRTYLHRGIAARQFQRTFVLAEGIQVRSADLDSGLLHVDLVRPQPERLIRKIDIGERG